MGFLEHFKFKTARLHIVCDFKQGVIKYEEKSKTTARLTQRDIFKTIFRLAPDQPSSGLDVTNL